MNPLPLFLWLCRNFSFIILPSLFAYIGFKGASSGRKEVIEGYKGQNFDLIQKGVNSSRNSLSMTDFSLNFYFFNKSNEYGMYNQFLGGPEIIVSYDGISSREYHNQKYQKRELWLLVITLSIFSVITAMKNLKDLFDG